MIDLRPEPRRSRVRKTLSRVRAFVVFYGFFVAGRERVLRRVRPLRRKLVDRRAVRRYLEVQTVPKLQIGAGPNPLSGWLNTDLFPDIYPEHRSQMVFMDAARAFPFADMTFDYVFAEHQIEHISEAEAHTMLRECFRVLRPGGRIRIATPSLEAIVALYDDPLDELQQHYVDWVMTRFGAEQQAGNSRCYVINRMFNAYGHQFIYDSETLSAMLRAAGFVDLLLFRPGESGDPVLRGIEAHGRAIGDEDVNRLETMVLEASRPR